jgi:excisionase family DNA binding protein
MLALNKLDEARMLGVSARTVDRLIALKRWQVRRLGRRVLIPRNRLQNLLRADHPTQSQPTARTEKAIQIITYGTPS